MTGLENPAQTASQRMHQIRSSPAALALRCGEHNLLIQNRRRDAAAKTRHGEDNGHHSRDAHSHVLSAEVNLGTN